MLHNYLIESLIMMPNINIGSYNKLFYKPLKIHCTNLLPHLRSTLQKLSILKFEAFQCTENFESYMAGEQGHNFVSVPKILR